MMGDLISELPILYTPYDYFKNSLRYELNRQQHQIEVLNSTETNQKRMEDSITRLGSGPFEVLCDKGYKLPISSFHLVQSCMILI